MNTKLCHNKQFEMILTWVMLSSLFLGSCAPAPLLDGQVEAIQPGTSLYVIQQAAKAAWGTIRMQRGDIVLLAMWMKDVEKWGVVMINQAAQNPVDDWALLTGGTGSAFTRNDFREIVINALNNGWKVIPGAITWLSAVVEDAGSWLRVMPTLPILIIPGAIFDEMGLPEPEYK